MISLVVYCVDKETNKYQYAFYETLAERIDVVSKSLRIQADVHKKLNFPNLVFLTNFDFKYEDTVSYDLSHVQCKSNVWGNKYTLPLEYIIQNNIHDDIWLHDYDCFPQEVFDFPNMPANCVGGITTKSDQFVNGGSLFIPKGSLSFFKTLKDVYDLTSYHRSDETLLNDLFFYKDKIIQTHAIPQVREIFRKAEFAFSPLEKTYNYSFAMAKHIKSLDYIPKTLHFHPESPDQWGCFKGKNIVKKEIEEIFFSHCPENYQKMNQDKYNNWRHKR